MRATVLMPLSLELGEGAGATGPDGEFYFVDIYAGRVFRGTTDGHAELLATYDHSVGAAAPTTTGTVVIAGHQGITTLDGSITIELPPQPPDLRLNDSRADPVGRFICGTMADPPREHAGALWSFGPQGPKTLVKNVTISNGLCWPSNGEAMFYVDTPTQRIDKFDYDQNTGEVSGRRHWAIIDERYGSPDGITIDEEGGVWVALWGGSAVHRYVDGFLDLIVEVPTQFVTSVAIVDRLLLITSARKPAPNEPLAGHVFCADVGIGAPPPNIINTHLLAT